MTVAGRAHQQGKLVVVSGPSGVGKSTICRKVIERTGAVLKITACTAHDHHHAESHEPSAGPPQAGRGPLGGPAVVPHGRGGSILFIENVGNLVCPAMWDLGEAAKIAILSVTEGEDKPLKYPDMFAAATLMVLNKTDLLPHLDFDVPKCIEYAQRVNPGIEVLLVSAKTGAGLDAWVEWLLHPPA